MWFDRARFGHLDDDAFEALHHPPLKSSEKSETVDAASENIANDSKLKKEKSAEDSVLKLSDFTHLKKKKNRPPLVLEPRAITQPTDGRWVLAVRAAESIRQGEWSSEKQQRLVKLGKLLGLTPLDTQNIITIIKDCAGKGIAPEELTRHTFAQLEKAQAPVMRSVKKINWFSIFMTTVLLLMIEVAALFSVFGK